MNINYFILC